MACDFRYYSLPWVILNFSDVGSVLNWGGGGCQAADSDPH
jgi:hypothetical protein